MGLAGTSSGNGFPPPRIDVSLFTLAASLLAGYAGIKLLRAAPKRTVAVVAAASTLFFSSFVALASSAEQPLSAAKEATVVETTESPEAVCAIPYNGPQSPIYHTKMPNGDEATFFCIGELPVFSLHKKTRPAFPNGGKPAAPRSP